jgi:hypothetical protein
MGIGFIIQTDFSMILAIAIYPMLITKSLNDHITAYPTISRISQNLER